MQDYFVNEQSRYTLTLFSELCFKVIMHHEGVDWGEPERPDFSGSRSITRLTQSVSVLHAVKVTGKEKP